MAKKAAKKKSKPAGLGNEGPPGAISKSEAVRRALADGVDQPADGVAYILSQFGIEMGPQHFSAVKSAHLKKQGIPTVNTRFQPKAEPTTSNGEADLLESLETLKPLIAQYGADKVKRLVDLLGWLENDSTLASNEWKIPMLQYHAFGKTFSGDTPADIVHQLYEHSKLGYGPELTKEKW
jgi:hypothetical protein